MNRSVLALIFLFFFHFSGYGQFSPGIQNYTLAEYKAGNQNWDIARSENGKIYVANNSGLLEYDGLSWSFYQLPNKTTIRSVLAYNDQVFTGSYEEFGFWEKDDFGQLKYQSLSETISNQISSNEEIWQIVAFNGKIIFRSFQNMYVYDFKDILQLTAKSTIISVNAVDDNLYVCTLNDGVFVFEDNRLNRFYHDSTLTDTKIISINKYQDKLLLTTALKGSFFLRNKQLSTTNFEIDDKIKEHQLNEFSILDNGQMVFGTIKDGVFLTNPNGQQKYHISKENGLVNNTVLGQYVDEQNSLWLGLDNGISKIDLNSPNYFYNDISGKLGAVYDVIKHKGVVYVGSNTGLFRLDENDKLKFIEGSQGQVWDLKIIGEELFCGHNEGTFLVNGDELQPISNFTGGWTIKKVPEKNKMYIQGTYSGLVKFQKTKNDWEVTHLGKTTIPSRFLVFENPHTAWVAHAYKGLYRVEFDEHYDSITSIHSYLDKGISSNFNIRVYNIKNNISFKTNEGWQRYEPIQDSIIPYKLLNEKLGKNSYIISEENLDQLALMSENGTIRFKSFSNQFDDFVLTDNFFKDRFIVGYENISKISDSVYALNLDYGFMIMDKVDASKGMLYTPTVESIMVDKTPIATSQILNNGVSFDYNRSLNIKLSSPKSTNYTIEYSLVKDGGQWYNAKNGNIEFSNLKHGDYEVFFRTKDSSGKTSKVSSIGISVLPPWYKDTLGYVLYVLLVSLVLFLVFILHKRKIAKEQRLIKIKYQREQQKLLREKSLENEKRIVQLKNQSLKSEVNLKSKQLANTAMALVKKNEMLQEIKNELMENRNNFANYYAFKKLLRKVDNSIVLKDQWEVFEYNFNQVHEEFFEKLKEEHTSLTPKDLKICAYIKMNLSTKEIAPLMNISPRGVETHRYRLKKKMNLGNAISLVDYLLNFK